MFSPEKIVLLYDGSYEGLLTTVFECYQNKWNPEMIVKEYRFQQGLFDSPKTIISDMPKAERVLKGLRRKLTAGGVNSLRLAFHSEFSDIEMTILRFIQRTIASKINIEQDYRQDEVLRIKQVRKMMNREIHRMHAFVRFQKTADSIYAATIKPDFDVMPFIGDHFRKRYADQQWLIYDTLRDYGLYYDLRTMEFVKLNNPEWEEHKQIRQSILTEEEVDFKKLWKEYFQSTSIKERKNMKLHLQHVPRRYWRYLPEKL